MKLALLLEQSEPELVRLDAFIGTVREFRLYLKVQRVLLEGGHITS